MKVELEVNIRGVGYYTAHLKGDDTVIESVLTIYTRQLLVEGTDFKVSFIQGDDQT